MKESFSYGPKPPKNTKASKLKFPAILSAKQNQTLPGVPGKWKQVGHGVIHGRSGVVWAPDHSGN